MLGHRKEQIPMGKIGIGLKLDEVVGQRVVADVHFPYAKIPHSTNIRKLAQAGCIGKAISSLPQNAEKIKPQFRGINSQEAVQ